MLILLVLFFSGLGVSIADTGASSFAVFELGMTLGEASAMRVISVIAFILCALPSGLLATRIGRKQTVGLGLLVVVSAYGLTYFLVVTPTMYAAALFVVGVGGALVLVNILPLVFDVGDERFIGAFTGLSGVPAQLAAVIGPSVAGVIVETVGSQRVLFLIAVVAIAVAWRLLVRLKAPARIEHSPTPSRRSSWRFLLELAYGELWPSGYLKRRARTHPRYVASQPDLGFAAYRGRASQARNQRGQIDGREVSTTNLQTLIPSISRLSFTVSLCRPSRKR
jgi:MFS family permease